MIPRRTQWLGRGALIAGSVLSHGIDPLRLLKAAWVHLITFSTAQGAGALTRQTARQLFLTLEQTWIRKSGAILPALYERPIPSSDPQGVSQ